MNGDRPQCDIVRFGTGEVEKRRTITLLWNCAHIDLQSGAQDDGGAGAAVGEHLSDILVGHEFVTNSRRMGCGNDEVQIPDSLTAAAKRAGPPPAAAAPKKSHERFSLGLGD